MAKVTVRISSATRETMRNYDLEVLDFLETLVIRFNDEIKRFGEDSTLLELLKFKTKRKIALEDDAKNAKDFMATLLTDDATYMEFKKNAEDMGMTVSEALRRLINRELAHMNKKRQKKIEM